MTKQELAKQVKAVLSTDLTGTRLEEASEAVTMALITNLPELLRERHDNERFEKLVWDTAAREGY